MDSDSDTPCGVGCPIRISRDQRSLASPPGFSQRATSFIASQCQGIHQMPLLRARAPLPTARIIQAEIGVRRSEIGSSDPPFPLVQAHAQNLPAKAAIPPSKTLRTRRRTAAPHPHPTSLARHQARAQRLRRRRTCPPRSRHNSLLHNLPSARPAGAPPPSRSARPRMNFLVPSFRRSEVRDRRSEPHRLLPISGWWRRTGSNR